MSDMSGVPAAMQWEIKRLKVLQKETVTMTPNKTQDVKPGQTIIVDLPYNSKVDSSSFTWFYGGSTTHNGSSGVDGPAGYVQTRFFPRNSSSVIQKFTVKINFASSFFGSDFIRATHVHRRTAFRLADTR
jgi:hypothetical protein